MADYNTVIPLTLKYEGGWSNHPNDTGGATMYGVSLAFAQSTNDPMFDLDHDGVITANDIKMLTKDIAIAGFKKYFWDKPYALDACPSDKKAFVVFDAAVNNGSGNATKFIQRACRALGTELTIDGAYGTKTQAAFMEAPVDDFCKKFMEYREAFFRQIAENRPSQRVFLKGWLNRVKNVLTDMETLQC